jgi:hypothetical protein
MRGKKESEENVFPLGLPRHRRFFSFSFYWMLADGQFI